MTTANCPGCGASVEFAIGSSAVVVCKYCRALVARTDRGVENDGKVAALIDTGSPLHVGLAGKYRGIGFRITGRTQMKHQAGGVWDEWYASLDDGRWGWLAEAQGKFYITFRTAEMHVPPLEQLQLGAPVAQIDQFVVTEIGTATLAAAEGELPWRPHPGDTYQYADLSGRELRFATIDYSEEKPIVFKGTEATLAELGIGAGEGERQARVAVTKLSCSNCGGPLELRAPDRSERIYCPNCGAGHDISQGKLQYLGVLKAKKVEPLIPLGKTGNIGGTPFVVAGFMERSVTFDVTYYWTEYLLYNRQQGFRWLVDSDDHWSYVKPIATGDVVDSSVPKSPARSVVWDGRGFKLFQVADATVTYVTGEFYWKVAVGEAVGTADYIRPPEGLSKEITTQGAQEVSWSHADYMQPEDVEKSFGVTVPRPVVVGPLQPALVSNTGKLWMMLVALMFVIAIVIAMTRANRVLFTQSISPNTDTPTAEAARGTNNVFTPAFNISGWQNIQINAAAPVSNTWAYVAGDLLNEDTGTIESFGLPVEYYSGYSDGESWSEGNRDKAIYISAPGKGRYSMRLEVQWEKADGPPVTVEVREGVFRWKHLFAAFVILTLPTLFIRLRRFRFEMQRWKDSDYSPYPRSTSGSSGGDDE